MGGVSIVNITCIPLQGQWCSVQSEGARRKETKPVLMPSISVPSFVLLYCEYLGFRCAMLFRRTGPPYSKKIHKLHQLPVRALLGLRTYLYTNSRMEPIHVLKYGLLCDALSVGV